MPTHNHKDRRLQASELESHGHQRHHHRQSHKQQPRHEESTFVHLLGDELLTQVRRDDYDESSTFLNSLLSHVGPTVATDRALRHKDFVLICFSAGWCGPCKRFLPLLKAFYQTVNQDEGIEATVEVVYVSSDRDTSEFAKYYGTMPWLAVHLEQQRKTTLVTKACHVTGIPALVVLNGQGELVTDLGKYQVERVGGSKSKAKSLIAAWKAAEAVPLEQAHFSHGGPLCTIL